jgi:hypothetical protein
MRHTTGRQTDATFRLFCNMLLVTLRPSVDDAVELGIIGVLSLSEFVPRLLIHDLFFRWQLLRWQDQSGKANENYVRIRSTTGEMCANVCISSDPLFPQNIENKQ